eukprot:6491839-Amphidinium_carterae.2
MYSGRDTVKIARTATAVQRKVLEDFRAMVWEMERPPPGASAAEALSELRCSFYGDDTPSFVSMDVDRIALPPQSSRPVPLGTLLGERGHERLAKYIDDAVLPKEAALAQKDCQGVRKAFHDPVLSSQTLYGKLICRLVDAGVVELCNDRESQKEQVGLFAVPKKAAGAQRLVVDCRPANTWFRPPERTQLPTGAALSRIELGENEELWGASVDIQSAFYNLQIPAEARQFFGLPKIRGTSVGLNTNGYIFPRLAVCPMGWNHGLALCQLAHEEVLRCGGITEHKILDSLPPPVLADGPAHLEYVDNFVALGTQASTVNQLLNSAVDALQKAGLPTHEEQEACRDLQVLGWNFKGKEGVIVPSGKRIHRLRWGIIALLGYDKVTGSQLARITGHYTFICMIHRSMLSVFDATYRFIERFWKKPTPLWPSVRRELVWAASVLPLARVSLRKPWSEKIWATDASEYARGVVSRTVDAATVASCGRIMEKWRDHEGISARDNALHDLGLFPEVPKSVLEDSWKVESSARWHRQEHISTLEGRAICHGLRTLLRTGRDLNHRVLFLSDSRVAQSALTKGRSSAPGLCRVSRQFFCLCAAGGLDVRIRWVPSESNPADRPSREYLQIGSTFLWQCHVEKEPPFGGDPACEAMLDEWPRRAPSSFTESDLESQSESESQSEIDEIHPQGAASCCTSGRGDLSLAASVSEQCHSDQICGCHAQTGRTCQFLRTSRAVHHSGCNCSKHDECLFHVRGALHCGLLHHRCNQ